MPTEVVTKTAAQFLPLTEEQWKKFETFLDTYPHLDGDQSIYVMHGCIGIREDLLQKAAHIVDVFHRVCKALHAEMQSDIVLRKQLLAPLSPIPQARAAAENTAFFLQSLRMDFFLTEEGEFKIIEVNSCGGGITDALRSIEFLQQYHSFHPPSGFRFHGREEFLKCILAQCKQERPDIKTLGFAVKENGCDDYLPDYITYAEWMKENSDIQPVFLEIEYGEMRLFDDPTCPPVVQNVSELDAVLCDWFEDLDCLERVQKIFDTHDILVVPPRSDLLFENKAFLSLLQRIPRPRTIPEDDWQLLQNALIRSFPLQEFKEHKEEMQDWDGVVLKMDIDCASENVFIYDFAKMSLKEALTCLDKKLTSSNSFSTWTVQQFIRPPSIPLPDSFPEWIELDYKPYKYDLMTYFVYERGQPHVIFGCRGFSLEKIDELTEEGQEDGIYAPVCVLP